MFLLTSLALMTAGWAYAWHLSTATEPLVAPPGFVYVSVPRDVPHPGEDEGWHCRHGSINSPYFLEDPLCLVQTEAVTAGATPVAGVQGGSDPVAATMTVVTGFAALLSGLGAIGVQVSRKSATHPPQGTAT